MTPQSKHIAVFGDINSIWVRSYLSNVALIDKTYQYYLFADHPFDKKLLNSIPANCLIIDCSLNIKKDSHLLENIYYFCRAGFEIIKHGCFSVYHIHFVNKRKLFLVRLMRRFTKKTIISFWGSDLLDNKYFEVKKNMASLDFASVITVGSSKMYSIAKSIFNNELIQKTEVVRFGVNGLNNSIANEVFLDRNALRLKWKIPISKNIITIGYNGSKRQNHINILKQIECLPQIIKLKLFLLLPMTYGAQDDYIQEVKTLLKQIGCEFRIISEYLGDNENAELCAMADVFIHGQTTDSFSASVQEHLFFESIVLNPIWIQYDELIENDVYYITYKDYSDINGIIKRIIENGLSECTKKKLRNNRYKIMNLSSWDVLKNKWFELY